VVLNKKEWWEMKTLMLGWEFPPYISGGLGTACYGLTKALSKAGVQITFVLPRANKIVPMGNLNLLSAQGNLSVVQFPGLQNVAFFTVASTLRPYITHLKNKIQQQIAAIRSNRQLSWHSQWSDLIEHYSGDLFSEVMYYAAKAVQIAECADFDVIHAHDWMTFPAGIAVAQISSKPLIVHVHSTEFDRSGEHVNQTIYNIERQGMNAAEEIITVSDYTKNIIINRYDIAQDKIEVVYNGIESNGELGSVSLQTQAIPEKSDKIVLFLGRITMQKGPEYFLAAAKKVLEKVKNVKFVMAGNGDMMYRMVELAAQMGIGQKVTFTGFLHGSDVNKIYQMADLYVMPSVSEPFGIAPLEALDQNVPVLISKQSGVAELLTHALKVDFWDINEMANKIIAVLKRPALRQSLRENGKREVQRFRWEDSAAKVLKIYQKVA
jgi:glycosyltransferase involved in cell wall biosynthesis